MIIPSSSFASVSSIKKPAAGGAADVTLNPTPNWDDPFGFYPSKATTISQSLTGINTSINIAFIVLQEDSGWEYQKNSDPWISGYDGMVISISNNDTLAFRGGLDFNIIEVYNATDNNTLLDTITMSTS